MRVGSVWCLGQLSSGRERMARAVTVCLLRLGAGGVGIVWERAGERDFEKFCADIYVWRRFFELRTDRGGRNFLQVW